MKTAGQITKRIRKRDVKNILTLINEATEEMYCNYKTTYKINIKDRLGYMPPRSVIEEWKVKKTLAKLEKFREYKIKVFYDPERSEDITFSVEEIPDYLKKLSLN